MTMIQTTRASLAFFALAALLPGMAQADRYWYGGDHHRFHERDPGRWQRGYWHHGRHLGRHGWWWVVGGTWYYYAQPVYPYPDPYPRSVVVVTEPTPAPAVISAPTQYWYYCEAAKSYYPYVATCPAGWRKVPATPSQ